MKKTKKLLKNSMQSVWVCVYRETIKELSVQNKGQKFLVQTNNEEVEMKKFAATLCIVGTALALSACETSGSGNVDSGPPYSSERTAGYSSEPAAAPAEGERVFKQYQSK